MSIVQEFQEISQALAEKGPMTFLNQLWLMLAWISNTCPSPTEDINT